jgi:DNA polymerase-3 subunit gamma/tau
MAYLVLARKYRPQGFPDLTGQEHVVQTLSNAIKGDRVAHAHLFCGPRGCGKTTTARIVAKALNCEKGPTPNPCGVCRQCVEITAGISVDCQEIDAASNTGVDNVRDLRESAKYLPQSARFKIFIVDEVHMLSKAAFNAFLKTLEEPPGHVKFLFATTDPQALPDTILSRCQRHNFRLVPLKLIADRIRSIAVAENVQIEDGAIALVARQAAGSMRDALSLLDQVFSSCAQGAVITAEDAANALGALDRGVISALAGSLLARDAKGVLDAVGRAYDGGHDLKRLAEDLATHLRNLVAASVAGAPVDLPDHELKALREQAGSSDPVELSRLFDLTHSAIYEISRATQPRHALEIALLKAVYLAPSTSVQTLLTRADDIVRRLGGEAPPPPAGGGGGATRNPFPAAPRPRPSFDAPSGPPYRSEPRQEATTHAPAAATAAAMSAPVAAPITVAPVPPPVSVPAPPPPVAAAPAPVPVAQPAAARAAAAAAAKPWERHLSLVPTTGDAAPPPAAPIVAEAPAPPSPVAPPPAPMPEVPAMVADTALMEQWPRLVEGIRARKKMLGTFLEHARPLSLTSGELSLGFQKGDVFAQSVTTDRQTLEGLLGELLQTPTKVRIVELQSGEGAAVASLAESNDKAAKEARDARLRAGREHPAVLRAVQMLGAEIEEVKDLGGGTR